MKIRCIIVDDEQPALDELRYLLSQYDDIEIVAETNSANKAVDLIKKSLPDLVFLDIQMPGKTGFDVLHELSGMAKMPLIVFVTAFDNYAVKAFEESAVDYLLKPLSVHRLDMTLQRVRQKLLDESGGDIQKRLQVLLSQMETPKEMLKVSVENNGRIQLLAPAEIVYCLFEDGRIFVHTRDQTFPLYSIATMDKLSEHLVRAGFFRAHRAVLVNLNCIHEFSPWFNGKYNLIMADTKRSELTVSRTRVKEFKQRLGI
jgi:DNA-binding LytR/AlgR family response regulator